MVVCASLVVVVCGGRVVVVLGSLTTGVVAFVLPEDPLFGVVTVVGFVPVVGGGMASSWALTEAISLSSAAID